MRCYLQHKTLVGLTPCSTADDGSSANMTLTEPRSLHVVERQWPCLLVQLSDHDGGVGERQVEVQQYEIAGYTCQHLHTTTLYRMAKESSVPRYYGADGKTHKTKI